eukprot:TRINITY_DN60593_c0_g1_i1.p1 TRINITY_DN60593_c0_g1~~TRINITY_DN60593_c0_g1_i1.p1  ORF type:complete len:572 (-),score=110.65 TRINITY_DN60593_c0_g1_i1:116-1831(-)
MKASTRPQISRTTSSKLGSRRFLAFDSSSHVSMAVPDSAAAPDQDDDDWGEDDTGPAVAEAEPSLRVAVCPGGANSDGEVLVAVGIDVPELPDDATRLAVDVCCLIDVSGSMSSAVTVEVDGQQQDDGLNTLDIVKHATRVVIKSLMKGDRLTIVAFESEAHTYLELTDMDDEGQQKAMDTVESLRTMGSTNVCCGLLAGMDCLRIGNAEPWRKQTLLLLTDGQPNDKKQVEVLRNYRDTHPNFQLQINTFGFGYSLDSDLLLQTSEETGGTFAFVPDALILGTTFVHCVANCLSCFCQSSTLNLMPLGGAQLSGKVLAGHRHSEESWGVPVYLGPLQRGSNREAVFRMKLPADASPGDRLQVVLNYPKSSGDQGRVTLTTSLEDPPQSWAKVAALRAEMVDVGLNCIQQGQSGKVDEACQDMEALRDRLMAASGSVEADVNGGPPSLERSTSPSLTEKGLECLTTDVKGRAVKSLTGSDRFNRWGKHFLKALVRAHQLKICTNFMDPGLQVYGGAGLFQKVREECDQIFITLPPPTPSRKPEPALSASGGTTSASAGPDMTTYYAGAGGG